MFSPYFFWMTRSLAKRLLLVLVVGGEGVAALRPLDVVSGLFLPAGEDLQAAEADADLGRVGVGGPEASDGVLVRALPRAGEGIQNEGPDAGPGQGHGRRGSDAPGADDDGVVSLLSRGHGRPPCRRRSRRRSPRGTSMNSGRLGWSTISDSGTPSSRKRRWMRGVQVLAPHEPMQARVTALISLMSREPARMRAPDLPGRHPLAAADDRVVLRPLDVAGHRLGHAVLLDGQAGDLLGDGLGRADLDQDRPVIGLDRPDADDLDPSELGALRVEDGDRVPGLEAVLEELVGKRDGGILGILPVIDEGDGQPGADDDALLAARAALPAFRDAEDGQAADVVRVDVDEVLLADRRARIAGDLLDAMEDGEDPRLLRRQLLGRRRAGPGLEDFGRVVPFLLDLADVDAELPRDLEAPDLAREDGRRGLGDLLGVARGEGPHPELPGFEVELVDRVEADGDEDGVALERPLRARDGPPFLVEPGDRHGFDRVRPVGAQDRVGGVDRDAEAAELVLVDLVAAALGERLDEPDDGDPRLEGVIAGDEADVAPADDEKLPGRPDEVAVDDGLERAGAVDAGQGVAAEGERLLPGARSDEEDLGPDEDIARPFGQDADLAVAERGQGGALQPDADRGVGPELGFELGGDVDAARPGVDHVIGPEEAVGLEDELPAQAVLVVHEERLDAALAELDRRGQAGRPAADDEDGDVDLLDGLDVGGLGHMGEGGKAGHRLDPLPGRTISMQALTGSPSARTRHWAHWPLAQKIPCGALSL